MKYVGANATNDQDIAYEAYVESIKSLDLTTGQIDTEINSGLTSYALTTYVDTQDAKNATKSYVDAGDALRVPLALKDVPNGIAALDATGRVNFNRFDVANTQKFNRGPWTPSAYQAAGQSITTETTIFTVPVTDPGYSYKLAVYGEIEARTSLSTEYPVVVVRVGSTSGPIIARGRGLAGSYQWSTGLNGGDDFERTESPLSPTLWTPSYDFGAGSSAGGFIAIPSGGEAIWSPGTNDNHATVYLRALAADSATRTDDQIITLTQGSVPGLDADGFWDNNAPALLICCRCSTGFADCVFAVLYWDNGNHKTQFYYRRSGGTVTAVGSSVNTTLTPGTVWAVSCVGRNFTLTRNGVSLNTWNDSGAVSLIGATARGWGFGMQGNHKGNASTQGSPGSVADVRIQDNTFTTSNAPVRILPQSLHTASVLTGATTLYVQGVRSGASSTVTTSTTLPKIFPMAVPA